jgi:predicted DNA binding protein
VVKLAPTPQEKLAAIEEEQRRRLSDDGFRTPLDHLTDLELEALRVAVEDGDTKRQASLEKRIIDRHRSGNGSVS